VPWVTMAAPVPSKPQRSHPSERFAKHLRGALQLGSPPDVKVGMALLDVPTAQTDDYHLVQA
jgi:hypothetical protein